MQRRLVVTLVGVVVVGLFLAGLGTVFQARLDRQSFTRDQLIDRAKSTTAFIDETLMATDRSPFGGERLRRITHALGVSEFGLLIVNETSSEPLDVLAALPDGLDFAALDLDELFANGTSSGAIDGRAWAAALSKTSLPKKAAAIVVVTGEYDDALGDAVRWFLFAAFATVILAVFVALRLSKQMAQPIIEATKTAGRLADGDLTSRLPQPGPQDTDEAADLARAINTMAANLERARGVERQFLLSVSHDLRTPMTSIQGYAEALTDGTATDAQRAGAIILSESRRLDRLVRDLLELARLDARQFTMHQQSIDLSQAAQRSLEGFRPSAQ
ncbi:MAG: HAMP domain-containing histidine kinase, partial [Gemmatimonadetes bacterium]|nr:HAMP domain-containing histidine kinase [Gemmatimonadota bacterium]